MSAWALSARPPARAGTRAARAQAQPAESLALQLAAFFALAAFAAHEYATLLLQAPAWRLLAAAALATTAGGALAQGARAGRAAPLLGALAALLAAALGLIAIGVPGHLIVPWHWAALERDLHRGYLGLSGWLWPYRGSEQWSQRTVLALVPIVLAAAAALRFWPSPRGVRLRSGAALLLLLGLFVTGAANQVHPVWRFQGAALTALVAAWLWLPGLRIADAGRAGRWLLAGATLALLAAPALDGGAPWIDYRAWNPVAVTASFEWNQVYGPIPWSRSTAAMLEVAAADSRPELLRVTSLDRFDGVRFLRSAAPPGSTRLDRVGANSRWLTQATITIAGLRSAQIVTGGGLPLEAQWLSSRRETLTSAGDGTATFSSTPHEGDSYRVLSYAPSPSAAALRRAPRRFPRAYLPYAQFALPDTQPAALEASNLQAGERVSIPPPVTVGPSAPGRAPAADPRVARAIEASPYAPMFALARRLASGARNDYEIVERIQGYLSHGYRYDENVPAARYPLETFLFATRAGYCQQFSGAMTLLLRMAGVPARVAAGFRPGVLDPATSRWRVRALDAHSWVEVYFSGIGWVPFDPTPARGATAPAALSGVAGLPSKATIAGAGGGAGRAGGGLAGGSAVRRAASPEGAGGGPPWVAILLAVAGLALLVLAALWLRGALRLRRALAGDAHGAVGELHDALARLGLPPAITLAGLEAELAGAGLGGARRYVRHLRELRYGARQGAARPTSSGRRHLRRALGRRAAGRRARLRALLALPPGAARRAARPS